MSYTEVKTLEEQTFNQFSLLSEAVLAIDVQSEMQSNLTSISSALNAIHNWAVAGEQNTLLSSFLVDMKTLMDNYSLHIDVVQAEAGYGQSWGGTETAVKFSVTKDGVSAEKVVNSINITSSDFA